MLSREKCGNESLRFFHFPLFHLRTIYAQMEKWKMENYFLEVSRKLISLPFGGFAETDFGEFLFCFFCEISLHHPVVVARVEA